MQASLNGKLEKLMERFEEVSGLLSDPDIIADQKQFRSLSKEYAELEAVVKAYRAYRASEEELESARALLDDGDPEMREMGAEEARHAQQRIEELDEELQRLMLPRDPRDGADVYLEIRAGTGGDEAALFAGDLFKMYSRYADQRGWKVEIVSASEGEHGGYKEVIAQVSGDDVYSRLKFESGAHRVQRVPATESQGRIHTAACTVAVLAAAEDAGDIEIRNEDLRIDTYRSSGAGGQHVNTTDSAVRITHHPTGIVVTSSEKSQHQNRDIAMKALKSRLYQMELDKRSALVNEAHENAGDAGWGNQIRSYVLQPYQMVKDLRTQHETSDTQGVLDGALDEFMAATLAMDVSGKSRAEAAAAG